jgi:hypothetical protein
VALPGQGDRWGREIGEAPRWGRPGFAGEGPAFVR